jgi:hypothetical protein
MGLYAPLKCHGITELHGLTTPKAVLFIVTSARTSYSDVRSPTKQWVEMIYIHSDRQSQVTGGSMLMFLLTLIISVLLESDVCHLT